MISSILLNEYKGISEIIGASAEKLKWKSVLVTGANGLIASYLIEYLQYLNSEYDYNIQIYALSRSTDKLQKRFKNPDNLIFVQQDLNEGLNISQNFDYIIHAASNAHPAAFSKDPVGTMKTNLLGTMNLLDMIKDTSAKFLYLSTGEIYGNNVDKAFVEEDAGLVDTKLVRSCYPESKRAAETLCMAYSEQYGIRTNIARLCYVYGPAITEDNSRADAQFLRNAVKRTDIVMKSEGHQRRTWCYIADAVSGLLYILLNGGKSEVYNIANPNSVASVREYAQIMSEISGVKLKFELPDEIERKGYSKPADSVLDSAKLRDFGWKPLYDLKTGVYHTLSQTEAAVC